MSTSTWSPRLNSQSHMKSLKSQHMVGLAVGYPCWSGTPSPLSVSALTPPGHVPKALGPSPAPIASQECPFPWQPAAAACSACTKKAKARWAALTTFRKSSFITPKCPKRSQGEATNPGALRMAAFQATPAQLLPGSGAHLLFHPSHQASPAHPPATEPKWTRSYACSTSIPCILKTYRQARQEGCGVWVLVCRQKFFALGNAANRLGLVQITSAIADTKRRAISMGLVIAVPTTTA